jgi:hypothetical protein
MAGVHCTGYKTVDEYLSAYYSSTWYLFYGLLSSHLSSKIAEKPKYILQFDSWAIDANYGHILQSKNYKVLIYSLIFLLSVKKAFVL